MNGPDPIQVELRTLASEIRDDLTAITRLVDRIRESLARIGDSEDPPPAEVMAIAGYLHHAYTGIESIHERIATRVDGVRPGGDRWHQELLTRMGVEVCAVRPSVVTGSTRAQLSRLLRFRHFFRHAYRIDLLWLEVAGLARDAERIVAAYRADMDTFLAHLESASEG